MNTIYSIVSPTILQTRRLSDGSHRVSVSVESHAPSHAYITLADYEAHAEAGFITIHSISEPTQFGYVSIHYSVN